MVETESIDKALIAEMLKLILESNEPTSVKLSLMLDMHSRLVGNQTGSTITRILESLPNLIYIAEIPTALSTISDIDDGVDPQEKMEMLRDITYKALDTKTEIISRLEDIIKCSLAKITA